MNINLKNEKGITMIAIVITIIILLIIISTVSFSSKNGIDMKKLNNMYADILILEEKISVYYLKNGTIPIKGETINLAEIPDEIEADNPNNGTEFYDIDLDKLENISLNNNNSSLEIDKYIINYDSHAVYYLKGVTVNEYRAGISGAEEKTYYGVERDYTLLDVENLISNTINAP